MATPINRYFGKGGVLEKSLPGYTVRPQQQEVATAVMAAMQRTGGVALIEAGTGVGKTLAYLIPALQRAGPNRKIVISTHTLALQAQLAEKDIPTVEKIWPHPIDAAIVKGRGNYLCLQDYDVARGDLWTAGDRQFAAIGDWSRATETGDVAELSFSYPGWSDIRVNSDTCRGQECRYFDHCFYYRMRRHAAEAEILLVNHALFFSDLAVRQRGDQDARILPDYDFVIFDEAHHLEAAASQAFGVSFSSNRLSGLLDKIKRAARQFDLDKDRLKAIESTSNSLFAPFAQVNRAEFIVEEVLSGQVALQNARGQVVALGVLLDGLSTELLKIDPRGQPAVKDRIEGLRRQCVRSKEELGTLFLANDDNFLRWGTNATRGRQGTVTTISWTPVSVAPLLKQTFWRRPRTAGSAIISATLSTNGGFTYLRERLGIAPDDPDVQETIVGSPFDYPNQCALYIPNDLAQPSDTPGYAYESIGQMISLIEAAHGGVFILFTSYRALGTAYDQITQSDIPYPILRQGEMPNARLIDVFKQERNAVLLGTQSFWEGVDVPGADLRLVIIDRLPFATPDSPVHKARVDSITAAGGDWFRDYALPQAQLRLKQGFGRLIRTATDHGVVAILDTRVIRKTYGQQFLRFLPPARRISTIEEVQQFFDQPIATQQPIAKVSKKS